MKKRSILLLLFAINIRIAFSQGSWDIDYLPIDSINDSFIGKEIRLDFKSYNADTLDKTVQVFLIRRLLLKKDTVTLTIGGNSYTVKENWNFYVDHGSINDQTLDGVNRRGKHKIKIKEMFLQTMNDSTLTIKSKVYPAELKRSNKKKESQEHLIVVDKSDVKGFLIRISDN